MNSLPKCSRYGEAGAQGEGAKAGSFEMQHPLSVATGTRNSPASRRRAAVGAIIAAAHPVRDDMHQSIFVAVLTALVAVTIPAAAQSPTSFPWCMKGARGGTSCYFRSHQDCAATVSGPVLPRSGSQISLDRFAIALQALSPAGLAIIQDSRFELHTHPPGVPPHGDAALGHMIGRIIESQIKFRGKKSRVG
jgi:hypothetical protein